MEPDGLRWSFRPGVSLSRSPRPRPVIATIARGRRQLRAGALRRGRAPHAPHHTHIYKTYTRAFKSAPLAESVPEQGLPRLLEQRPTRAPQVLNTSGRTTPALLGPLTLWGAWPPVHAARPWSRRTARGALPADWSAGCGAAVLIHFFRADPSSSHAGLARTAAVPRGRKRPEASGRAGARREGPKRLAGAREQGAPRPRQAGSAAPTAAPPRARAHRSPAPASPRAPAARWSTPGRGARPAVGTESPALWAGGN